MHALDRLRLAVAHACELAAEHRTSRHCGNLHAGDLYVDAELRGAVDLVGGVQALGWRADKLEVLRILDRDVAWQRQRSRLVDQRAVAEAAAGRSMDHLAPRSMAGVRIDLPCLRRGGDQQAARGGAGVAYRLPV